MSFLCMIVAVVEQDGLHTEKHIQTHTDMFQTHTLSHTQTHAQV